MRSSSLDALSSEPAAAASLEPAMREAAAAPIPPTAQAHDDAARTRRKHGVLYDVRSERGADGGGCRCPRDGRVAVHTRQAAHKTSGRRVSTNRAATRLQQQGRCAHRGPTTPCSVETASAPVSSTAVHNPLHRCALSSSAPAPRVKQAVVACASPPLTLIRDKGGGDIRRQPQHPHAPHVQRSVSVHLVQDLQSHVIRTHGAIARERERKR